MVEPFILGNPLGANIRLISVDTGTPGSDAMLKVVRYKIVWNNFLAISPPWKSFLWPLNP